MTTRKLTTEIFIKRGKDNHGDKYDYSETIYKNSKSLVTIICPIHGKFQLCADYHIGNRKRGCQECSKDKLNELFLSKRKDVKWFIEKSNTIHNNSYQYDDYVNYRTKVTIYCLKCLKYFKQSPKSHLAGYGCPNCKMSKGENRIERYLINNNIDYLKQHKFDGCVYKNPLFFDFFLPDINTCIEYDGKQHFIPVEKFGGQKEFEKCQIRDGHKNMYCDENDITLIRISYLNFKKIEKILGECL
tara:strand:+ start:33910 stop:34641 length:732 start_codon:yes stop_codon:yes gene_type:complete